jgi:hypothetical protein
MEKDDISTCEALYFQFSIINLKNVPFMVAMILFSGQKFYGSKTWERTICEIVLCEIRVWNPLISYRRFLLLTTLLLNPLHKSWRQERRNSSILCHLNLHLSLGKQLLSFFNLFFH